MKVAVSIELHGQPTTGCEVVEIRTFTDLHNPLHIRARISPNHPNRAD